jgi:hypothetical protein
VRDRRGHALDDLAVDGRAVQVDNACDAAHGGSDGSERP